MFLSKVVEKIKKITFSNFFSENIVLFMSYVEKYGIVGQGTRENMTHARCKPDT